MPIYAYKCSSCGHGADVMQKMSDAPLTVCPACGQSSYTKQITAAGFQLKGSGWYATDFKNGSGGAKKDDVRKDEPKKDEPKKETSEKSTTAEKSGTSADKPAPAADTAKPAPAA